MTLVEFSPAWFDESSKAWRANKIRKGESWVYRCSHGTCKKARKESTYCTQHAKEHETIADRVMKRRRATLRATGARKSKT